MWKDLAEWFGALCVTAAMAVSVIGAAEWIEKTNAIVPVVSDAGAYVVVVDAGHGGYDGGAKGIDTGVKEDGLNLAVAKRVEALLTKQGVQVLMTREDDAALALEKQDDMRCRKEVMNDPSVDMVVSIHMNAFSDRSISGAMAYYMAGSTEGQNLAQTVIDCVCDDIGRSRRLANPGDYFVLRESKSPAVLVECGFLSNGDEEMLLQDPAYQEVLAGAIAKGVTKYLET